MGAEVCRQAEICDKRGNIHVYLFIYIQWAHICTGFSVRGKTAHTPHHIVAHTQKFHCACFLPEQVAVSRELPVHRLCSRTQIGSARISDHCNLMILSFTSDQKHQPTQWKHKCCSVKHVNILKMQVLQLHRLVIELFSWYQSTPKAHFL